MIVETIVAFVAFLISLVGVCLLRGPVEANYHGKVADDLEASLATSFIIGVIGSFITQVWIRTGTIAVAALVGSCLGLGLHPLGLLYRSHRLRMKLEYTRLKQRVVDLAREKEGKLYFLDLIRELDVGHELVDKILSDFVRCGLAIIIRHPQGGVTIIFPEYLNPTEKKIIEKLVDKPEGLTFVEILHVVNGLSIDVLRYTLDRLESGGVLTKDRLQDKYKLSERAK
jgi:hypothetical protein